MNILNKLTLKNLKLNKKRTIVTVIGIMLSTALICCLAGLIFSFQATLISFVKNTVGDYHVEIENVLKEDLKYIANNKNVEKYYNTSNIGYSYLEEGINENKPYLHVLALDSVAYQELPVILLSGRLPENDSEIVISSHILSNGEVNYNVGDTLTLELGDRIITNPLAKDKILNQNVQYNECTDNDELEYISCDEELNIKTTKTYTIVGIIDRLDNSLEPYSAPGYSVLTYLDRVNDTANVYIRYKNPDNYEELTKQITNSNYLAHYNLELISYEGYGFSENNMSMFYSVGIIVSLIIIVTSVFVIKNSFSISVTEKTKQYGMLASVGATAKQIRKSVLNEGLIIGLIAVPLGILCGIFANIVLIKILNILLGDYLNGFGFVFNIPLLAIIISIVLSFVTIILSCIIPSIKASRITPIDAMRNSNDIKIKNRKLKTPKIISKLFKIGGTISYKNLKRSKKKYRTTLISIVVSIVIFISLSTFIEYGFKISTKYYENVSYNVSIYNNTSDELYNYNLFKELAKLDNVDRYAIQREITGIISSDILDNNSFDVMGLSKNEEHNIGIEILSIGDTELNNYLDEHNIKLDDNTILLLDFGYYSDENSKSTEFNMLNLDNKDTINFIVGETNITAKTIRIKEQPMGLEYYNTLIYLIVPDKLFDEYVTYNTEIADGFHTNSMDIYSSDPSSLVDELKTLQKTNYPNLMVTDLDEAARANNAVVIAISIFLYGFISVISLIGVTNIFNTITTNMQLRKREFAMLRAIGMTDKEFNHMIRLESILYGLKGLIIGLPLGIALSFLIYLGFTEGLGGMTYVLPFKMILICIVFVFLIIFLTMTYSLRKINKQNIIETIREENI